MTTNQPPLTAEILQEIRERYSKDFDGAMALMGVYKSRIDAEAAQQNAELVAENKRLKQQLADFRKAAQKALSQPAEYMDLLNMFHDTQPPKEAT